MSYDFSATDPQSNDIKKIIRSLFEASTYTLVRETNKGIVIRALTRDLARHLTFVLSREGYHTDIDKGIHSDFYYVHISFNYPY